MHSKKYFLPHHVHTAQGDCHHGKSLCEYWKG